MRIFFAVVFYFLVRRFVSSSPIIAIGGEASNNPVARNFLRRALHATVVLGNYIYIDGGEFSQLIDGYPDASQVGPLNNPYCRQSAGFWSQTEVSDPTFSKLLRRSGASGAMIGETGHYIGGRIHIGTDPLVTEAGNFPQVGVVPFNSSSDTWDNQSSVGLNRYGTILNSKVITIPAFGPDGRGLLVVLGGQDPGIDSHGSNTLFVYGGINTYSNKDYANVYILTIPGFAWFQAPGGFRTPRFLHTCEVIGRRQLITIGGLDDSGNGWIFSDFPDLYQVPDPLTQGIGIFDMTAMEWMSSCNANAAAYESPKVVKEWNQALVQWQSKEIARMFIRDRPISVSATPVATAATTLTSTPNNVNCNSDPKTLALAITTSVLGLLIAAASAWAGFKQYQQKRLKAEQSRLRSKTPSPEEKCY
ncbi:hypothetical protein B0J14DRAFT_653545 [Halenospora varia]|nr:hypothetical protein B0J14DRAFT_653545 [Halenospora varia]